MSRETIPNSCSDDKIDNQYDSYCDLESIASEVSEGSYVIDLDLRPWTISVNQEKDEKQVVKHCTSKNSHPAYMFESNDNIAKLETSASLEDYELEEKGDCWDVKILNYKHEANAAEGSTYSIVQHDEIHDEPVATKHLSELDSKTDSPRAATQFPYGYCEFTDFSRFAVQCNTNQKIDPDDQNLVNHFAPDYPRFHINQKSVKSCKKQGPKSSSLQKRNLGRRRLFFLSSGKSSIPYLKLLKNKEEPQGLVSEDEYQGLTSESLRQFDESYGDVDDLNSILDCHTSYTSAKASASNAIHDYDEQKSREEGILRSLTASFRDLSTKLSRSHSEIELQFNGEVSKKSDIVRKLLSDHDKEASISSIESQGLKSVSSNSSLRAETDIEVVLDPLARPSKRMRKASNQINGDNDVWVEKILTHKKTQKQRSFFYSVKTGERKADEPPTGASKVIYIDSYFPESNERQRDTNHIVCGDNAIWEEKFVVDKESKENRG